MANNNALTAEQLRDIRITHEVAAKMMAVDSSRVYCITLEGDSYRVFYYLDGSVKIGAMLLTKEEVNLFLGL